MLKFIWEEQMVNNINTLLEKKNKLRWSALPDIKTLLINVYIRLHWLFTTILWVAGSADEETRAQRG